jgi:exosortase
MHSRHEMMSPTISPPGPARRLTPWIIAALLLALFFPVLRWLAGEWLGNDFYSHGLLVPFISAFVAWRLWTRRPPAITTSGNSWAGLALTVGSLAVYLLALAQRAYFAASLAMVAALAGLVWYLLGGAALRRLAFPILFLLFMIPLPFVEPLSVPLAQATGTVAAQTVRLFGVPISINGAQVTLPNANLVVGAQCSGLRSIVALLTLVALFVFAVQGPAWGKWVLALSAIPIAAFGNIVRVSSLLGVAHVWGADIGFTYYHDYSGILFFASAVLLLILASRLVQCNEIRGDLF